MLWDLGIKEDLIKNSKFLRDQIRQLDEYFDIALIAEQFDESLILMKELLCWDTQDILYFKVKLVCKQRTLRYRITVAPRLFIWDFFQKKIY